MAGASNFAVPKAKAAYVVSAAGDEHILDIEGAYPSFKQLDKDVKTPQRDSKRAKPTSEQPPTAV